MGDAHRREDHPEGLWAPGDLRLPRNLQRDLVVRQARTGEQRELLAAHERVEAVDRRDARLDELRGMFSGVRVDRGALDLDPLLREDRRTTVCRLAGSREDSAEHLARDGELDCLTEELHTRLPVDPRGALEYLHDDDIRRRVEDLTPLPPAVGQRDLDELVVADRFRLLDEDQRTRNLRDRAVFLRHSARLQLLEVLIPRRERLLEFLVELLLVLDSSQELAALHGGDVLDRDVEREGL